MAGRRWTVFRRVFFSGRRNGRKSSVLGEIVRFGWSVLEDLEMVLCGLGTLDIMVKIASRSVDKRLICEWLIG